MAEEPSMTQAPGDGAKPPEEPPDDLLRYRFLFGAGFPPAVMVRLDVAENTAKAESRKGAVRPIWSVYVCLSTQRAARVMGGKGGLGWYYFLRVPVGLWGCTFRVTATPAGALLNRPEEPETAHQGHTR